MKNYEAKGALLPRAICCLLLSLASCFAPACHTVALGRVPISQDNQGAYLTWHGAKIPSLSGWKKRQFERPDHAVLTFNKKADYDVQYTLFSNKQVAPVFTELQARVTLKKLVQGIIDAGNAVEQTNGTQSSYRFTFTVLKRQQTRFLNRPGFLLESRTNDVDLHTGQIEVSQSRSIIFFNQRRDTIYNFAFAVSTKDNLPISQGFLENLPAWIQWSNHIRVVQP